MAKADQVIKRPHFLEFLFADDSDIHYELLPAAEKPIYKLVRDGKSGFYPGAREG